MTEAELAELFGDHAEAVVTILFGFASITSGFLAATFLVAKSIPTLLASVMVGLYSFMAFAVIGYCERHSALLVAIRGELKSLGANWHTAVVEPQWVLPALSYSLVFSMVAIYAASVIYFLHARKHRHD